jgi:hypothetical protein
MDGFLSSSASSIATSWSVGSWPTIPSFLMAASSYSSERSSAFRPVCCSTCCTSAWDIFKHPIQPIFRYPYRRYFHEARNTYRVTPSVRTQKRMVIESGLQEPSNESPPQPTLPSASSQQPASFGGQYSLPLPPDWRAFYLASCAGCRTIRTSSKFCSNSSTCAAIQETFRACSRVS